MWELNTRVLGITQIVINWDIDKVGKLYLGLKFNSSCFCSYILETPCAFSVVLWPKKCIMAVFTHLNECLMKTRNLLVWGQNLLVWAPNLMVISWSGPSLDLHVWIYTLKCDSPIIYTFQWMPHKTQNLRVWGQNLLVCLRVWAPNLRVRSW